MKNKQINKNQLSSKKLMGLTICYGHFNVIHPGHIRYFENAKKYGKEIIVAIQDKDNLKGGSEILYSSEERLKGVSQVQLVDYVVLLEDFNLSELIEKLKPSNFVLGKEFEVERRAEVATAIEIVLGCGGAVRFDAGRVHYASTNFLSKQPEDILLERFDVYKKACERNGIDLSKLSDDIDKFQSKDLLVIGDLILDRYIACDALGMSSEAPIVVLREMSSKDFLGGAGIVAAHIASLGANVKLISMVGRDESAAILKKSLNSHAISCELIEDPGRPTTFKARYMVEAQKLYRVSRLEEQPADNFIELEIIEKINELSPYISGILVSDFQYGVITENVLAAIYANASKYNLMLYGDLQCSSQVGSILKFKNFDLLCPTEREARIALDSHGTGVEEVAHKLIELTNTKYLIFKMGSEGFIAYEKKDDGNIIREHFPALNANPLDVTGAGDSLLACMSLGLAYGLPFMHSAAMSACMAAISVQSMGNTPIHKEQLKNFLGGVLNS
jgi:rfaE bifunctional protein kinase chain/domain